MAKAVRARDLLNSNGGSTAAPKLPVFDVAGVGQPPDYNSSAFNFVGDSLEAPHMGKKHFPEHLEVPDHLSPRHEPEEPPFSPEKRYIHPEDHFQHCGVAVPTAGRHGRGRRFIPDEDHIDGLTHEAPGLTQEEWFVARPHVVPEARSERGAGLALRGHAESPAAPPSNVQVKEAILEWAQKAHGLGLGDERRWAEALVEQQGTFWTLRALMKDGRMIHKEGSSARAIAEKLALLPVSELRNFGLRFASGSPYQGEPRSMTLSSAGVRDALFSDDYQAVSPGQGVSNRRKDPEDHRRRYISTGKDHMEGVGCPQEQASEVKRRQQSPTRPGSLQGGGVVRSDAPSRKDLR